jgi:predicted amidohydrolase
MTYSRLVPIVLEALKPKEITGQETLIYTQGRIDFTEIYFYRQSYDEDGVAEPFTVVYLKTGISVCVDMTFSEFDELYTSMFNIENTDLNDD